MTKKMTINWSGRAVDYSQEEIATPIAAAMNDQRSRRANHFPESLADFPNSSSRGSGAGTSTCITSYPPFTMDENKARRGSLRVK